MKPLLLTMGAGDREAGILRIVDWETLTTISETEYRSELSCFMEQREKPPGMTPRCKLNGGSFWGESFYTCTYNEILEYRYRGDFELVGTISRPTFADLHHVHCDGNRLWVVSTGLDLVEELDLDGNLIRQYPVAPDVHRRYDLSKDYRCVPDTKPHSAHPSYLTEFNGRHLVTLQRKRRVVDLINGDILIDGFPGPIHDGLIHDGNLYYTSVNGYVVQVDEDFKIVNQFPTYPKFGRKNPGWCRGLYMKENNTALIGYTRSRKTNSPGFKPGILQKTKTFFEEYMKQLMGRPAYTLYPPMNSHLAEINLTTDELIEDYPLGGPSMTIYGIYELPESWAEMKSNSACHDAPHLSK